MVKHKGFHRYVIRAKRGTVQSAHDKKGGAPKSAGATLRRYNEQQLERDIHDLLHDWRQLLTSCALIFHRTSVNNRGFVFLSRAAAQKSNAKDSTLAMLARCACGWNKKSSRSHLALFLSLSLS